MSISIISLEQNQDLRSELKKLYEHLEYTQNHATELEINELNELYKQLKSLQNHTEHREDKANKKTDDTKQLFHIAMAIKGKINAIYEEAEKRFKEEYGISSKEFFNTITL